MPIKQSDNRTKSQLKVLRELSSIFEELHIGFWLKGGWAIDFMLGKITRQHSDIDLVMWVKNRKELEDALIKADYTRDPVGGEFRNRQSDFIKYHIVVSIGYLTYDEAGNLIPNGLPEWVWRADSLMLQNYQLQGIKAKIIHPKQLLDEKVIYREIGRPYRQKDEESKRILQEIIANFK